MSNDLAREVLIPHKTEAWGMMEDGHVQEPILMGHYDKEQGDYFVIKSQVKPRT